MSDAFKVWYVKLETQHPFFFLLVLVSVSLSRREIANLHGPDYFQSLYRQRGITDHVSIQYIQKPALSCRCDVCSASMTQVAQWPSAGRPGNTRDGLIGFGGGEANRALSLWSPWRSLRWAEGKGGPAGALVL